MRRMDFKAATFNAGLNYAVRLGKKWADLRTGDRVMLAQADGPELKGATVVARISCRFVAIPGEVLALEHAPDARTYEGLRAAMIAAYGDAFNDNSIVTCVGFIPDEEVI